MEIHSKINWNNIYVMPVIFNLEIYWPPVMYTYYIYIVIVIIIVIFIWWSPFIPSRNLDEVFTYNHIWL